MSDTNGHEFTSTPIEKITELKKTRGNRLLSADWNALLDELNRLGEFTSQLDNTKANREGSNTLNGNLTVWGNLELTGDLTAGGKLVGEIDASNLSGILSPEHLPDIPPNKLPETVVTTSVTNIANDYQKAQFSLSGGGSITWKWTSSSKEGNLRWGSRFIAISMEKPNSFREGHVNIRFPSTNSIPQGDVHDNAARTISSDGILLKEWEALYAVHTVGAGENAVSLKITQYTKSTSAPSNWLLVAVVNGDDGTLKLGTGIILSPNSAYTSGSWVPTGTILMWSGQVNNIPAGWALCNGQNNTPDLRNRFIVAAGDAYQPQQSGDGDRHSHGLNNITLPFQTDSAGTHDHGLRQNNKTVAKISGMVRDPIDVVETTSPAQSNGAHSHPGSVSLNNQRTGDNAPLRPPWYALCFIMKL